MTPAFTDNTPMPFGRYIGKPMISVPPKYLVWLHDNRCTHAGVMGYVNRNLTELKKLAASVPAKR